MRITLLTCIVSLMLIGMPNKPTKTNCNTNPMPRTTEDSGALARTGPQNVQELEYLESLKAVELIIEQICVPNARIE